jgi:hypothetical protein
MKNGQPAKLKNGNISTTGGRVYNQACFQKSGKKTYKDDDYRILRSDYFEAMGLKVTSLFDMKSQIPRITAVYNGIHHYEDIPDYYEWFRTKCELYKYTRQDIKDVFMRCYFEKDENAAWRHYRFSKMFKRDDAWFWRDNKIGWLEEDFRKLYQFIWSSIKPVGNFIFILTSLIEQTILYRAKRELNIEMINVYDEFLKINGGGGKVIKSDIINLSCTISNSIYNKNIDNISYYNKLNNINILNIIMPHEVTTKPIANKVINEVTTEDIKYINEVTTTQEPNEPIYVNEVTTKSVFICPADGQPCENCTCGATKDRIGRGACNQAVIADVPDANVILPDYDRWGKVLRR